MKAAYINGIGPAEGILYAELPEPKIGDEDVLVRIKAVAVDPIDTYIRSGAYKIALPSPFIIGRDMVGVVEKVGELVSKFIPGDRVWANNQGYDGRQGTFAELISVKQDFLYSLPEGVDEREAVAVFHSALTAVTGLFSKAQLKKGETLFINGGSGNVGSAVIQLAKEIGARVAVTAGSDEKANWCRQVGADLVINYKVEDIADSLRLFAPNGVDVYWDATKTPEPEQALALMARRGRMLIMSGLTHRCLLPVGEFYTHNCTLYGFTITDRNVDELTLAAQQINNSLVKGILKAKIHDIMPMSKSAEAHKLIEQGNVFGKIVLIPD